ncbi:MAG: thioredoxin domain-containing protein [Aggregatilineales bacterium]
MTKVREKRNPAAQPANTQARTEQRRKEREKQKQRQRVLTIVIMVGAVVLLIVLGIFLANQPSDAPIPEETLTRYNDIPVSRTGEGYPRLGDPDARVQISLYSSFDCPACKRFKDEAIDPLLERVRAGGASLIFVPLHGTGPITNGQGAARAALCAAEQGQFWKMHDALFLWQELFGNQAFTNSRINSGVAALELDRGLYDACIGSNRPGDVLTRARNQANALIDFAGTPTIAINGVVPLSPEGVPLTATEDLLAAIDRALEQFGLSSAPAPAEETPVEAAEETAIPEATAESASETEAVETPTPTAEPTEAPTPEAEVTAEASAT